MSTTSSHPPSLNRLPDAAFLRYPPLPRRPPGAVISSFINHQSLGFQQGQNNSKYQLLESDSRHRMLLVDVTSTTIDAADGNDAPASASHIVNVNRNGLVVLRDIDAWRIGDPQDDWEEPMGSTISDYDPSIRPFERLLTATRDFHGSRRPAFAYKRNKLLFDLMRNALGLRSVRGGRHWAAAGPRLEGEEDCMLLSRPLIAVRGFLATARREAEAGWDPEPAFRLAKITAAFLSFLLHHQVLPDIPELPSVVQLAQQAPYQLEEAKRLEDILDDVRGLNRASWVVWGGRYGNIERGGTDILNRRDSAFAGTNEDGGWHVDETAMSEGTPIGHKPCATCISALQARCQCAARQTLSPLIGLGRIESHHLTAYLPFGRRRISAVIQVPSGPTTMPFQQSHVECVTIPAPWTEEEGRRRSVPLFESDKRREAEVADDFEGEQATIEEPEELSVWIDARLLGFTKVNNLVGMAIRGRWAYVRAQGSEPEAGWWIVSNKDYVLPNFWHEISESR